MTEYLELKNIFTVVFIRDILLLVLAYEIFYREFTIKSIILITKNRKISIHFLENILLKIEIRYIEQTNIRRYFPKISLKNFLTAISLIFCFSSVVWINITGSSYLGTIFSFFTSSIPLIILDFVRYRNYQRIRSDIAKMLSILNRWYSIKEDLLMAFEKTAQSEIRDPLKTYVRDFVIQVNKGLDLNEAFLILERKIDSPFFRTFIINICQAVNNRGDVTTLLLNLENEAYILEQEYNRRRIKTVNDRMIIYAVMLSVLLIGYKLVFINKATGNFYMETAVGKTLILIYFILYLLGFIVSMGITKLHY